MIDRRAWDVVVVGGGFFGCSLASTLASAGPGGSSRSAAPTRKFARAGTYVQHFASARKR